MNRRDFLGITASGLVGLLAPKFVQAESGLYVPEEYEEDTDAYEPNDANIAGDPMPVGTSRKHKHRDYSKVKVPSLGYKHLVSEMKMTGVNLSDIATRRGRIERAMRWRNVTDAVASRYGMSSRRLLGMICVESEGDPTQPNDLGDGGAGLIHMQPLLASAYGLKMITKSKKLRDFAQGKKLRRAIELFNGDLKDLVTVDDRFHPVKNVDAAARMLCDNYQRTHDWNTALKRYAGRAEYPGNVMGYVERMASSSYMRKLTADFNERNARFTINGKPMTFDNYIKAFHELNRNYGVDDYKKKLKKLTVE